MSAIARPDADDDERNEWGLPPVLADAPYNRGAINQQVDQSVNKALPYVAGSWLLSGLAIGGVLLLALLMPYLIDSKVAAGVADAKSAMAQQAADAKATAQTAKEHARVALDKVEQTQVQLGANGLVQPSTH